MSPEALPDRSTVTDTNRPGLHWTDGAVVAWTVLFLAWVAFDLGGVRWATTFDFLFFGVLGPAVGALQLRVASRIDDPLDRRAWRLLAAASFARFTSGSVWGIWVALSGVKVDPPWMVLLASAYLVFGIAGLLTFRGVQWQREDWARFRLDAATILLGSLLVVWFFALGPILRSGAASGAGVGDYIYTLGDSATVVLAAALYLRSSTRLMRTVAVLLLLAFVFQVVPDIVFWSSGARATYRAGDPIAVVWYTVWALKWLAARYAVACLDRRPQLEQRTAPRYRSGPVPYGFLIAASALLLYRLLADERGDLPFFAIGCALLAILLVARQGVELGERDRLHQEMTAEEARYRTLLHHAYDAVLLLDPAGTVVYASPATDRLLGGGAAPGDPGGFLRALHPADVAAMEHALTGPSPETTGLTVRVRGASGEWRTLVGHLQDRRTDPDIGAFVLNALDRTRETRLSSDLREAQEVEALGVMAGGLAHDLNNILTVIGSHVDLLELDAPLAAQARADLRAIRTATDRATALTRGLLALSRRKQSARHPVDLAAFVRERALARRGHCPWLETLPAHAGAVRADPSALAQVVDALLDAADPGGSPGCTPGVRLETVEIDRAAGRALSLEAGPYVALRVGDAVDLAAEVVEEAIPTQPDGEWNLAPGDLAMLMALASVREFGGALTRERAGTGHRMALFLPAAA